MGVIHSSASESHTGTTGSSNQASFSWTHTQTGTPQGVLIFVFQIGSIISNGPFEYISSVTYGSSSVPAPFSFADDGAGEPGRSQVFFLGSGLPSGNQTITVNRTNNALIMYATAATFTAKTNTQIYLGDGIQSVAGDGTLSEVTINDGWPGSFSQRYAGTYSGLQSPPTAGANSTLLNSIDLGNYGAAMVRETIPGQGPRPVGFTGGSDDRAGHYIAIAEVRPSRVIVYS